MKPVARWFFLIVAAQALFLLGWAGYHEWVRQHAPVIRLQVQPVDPQDLLRGDYLTLRYMIGETTSDGAAKPERGARSGNDLWVLLAERDGFHQVVAVSESRLEPKADEVLVRGERTYRWANGDSRVAIDYGIERYYVPEGKGSPQFSRIEVEAAVSPAHRLYIKRLLLDGREYP